jgi:hypothetical protein
MASLTETLELMGMTRDELVGRVVKQITHDMLRAYYDDDEDSSSYARASEFHAALQKQIKEGIDREVALLAEKHVTPKVAEAIENMTLQETSKWGEKKGEPLSFIEYMVARAEAYMRESVDSSGKSKEESSSGYSFKGKQSRLSYMINSQLHRRIEDAVKAILANANASLLDGIQATVKAKLIEVSEAIKVTVKI